MRYGEYEQIKKSKEAVIVYFKILCWNSPRQTEEKHEKILLISLRSSGNTTEIPTGCFPSCTVRELTAALNCLVERRSTDILSLMS
jgi:hypothetical protein